MHRKQRIDAQIPSIALVGYTNAGKSTLLNTLTHANVFTEDQLFATLDPTTRKITLDNGQEILLTDTVGFIQKLPHQLIAAFRATLEEVTAADILLHIIDASHPRHREQSDAVFKVLRELKADTKTTITVFNKCDKLSPQQVNKLLRLENSIAVSALQHDGLDALLTLIQNVLAANYADITLLIPYDKANLVATVYDRGQVLKIDYIPEGISIEATMPKQHMKFFNPYIMERND